MKQLIFVCIFVCLARLSTGVAIKSDTLSSSSSSLQLEKNEKDTQQPELLQGKECAPGSTWKGQCNNQCNCSSEGYPVCTEIGCLEQQTEPSLRCAPGSAWKRDCNTCRCTSTGFPLCTLIECSWVLTGLINDSATDGPSYKEALPTNRKLSRSVRTIQSQTIPKNCKPGSEFRVDCNDCLCDNKGQEFSCTRFDCSKSKNGPGELRVKRDTSTKLTLEQVTTECVPESVFDQGCSVCRCLEDGHHAACSLKRCNQQGQDTSAENDINSSGVDSFRCNPGEQFKRDCNDCSCSADGKSVFCTLRLCDKDLAPTE